VYLGNRRKNIRVLYPCELEYSLESETLQREKARTVDISSGGMSLYLPNQLLVGQQIRIYGNALPFSCEAAKVRWVKETSDGNYIAGLEFCFLCDNKKE
jgi:c-di-GMP-binding flagellar brake protein YcgR